LDTYVIQFKLSGIKIDNELNFQANKAKMVCEKYDFFTELTLYIIIFKNFIFYNTNNI
jgi:hypothetical protein